MYGEYVILNKPTDKEVKRIKKKLARRCVKTVKKLIHENMDSFFIDITAEEAEVIFGREIGWKIDLPTLQEDK